MKTTTIFLAIILLCAIFALLMKIFNDKNWQNLKNFLPSSPTSSSWTLKKVVGVLIVLGLFPLIVFYLKYIWHDFLWVPIRQSEMFWLIMVLSGILVLIMAVYELSSFDKDKISRYIKWMIFILVISILTKNFFEPDKVIASFLSGKKEIKTNETKIKDVGEGKKTLPDGMVVQMINLENDQIAESNWLPLPDCYQRLASQNGVEYKTIYKNGKVRIQFHNKSGSYAVVTIIKNCRPDNKEVASQKPEQVKNQPPPQEPPPPPPSTPIRPQKIVIDTMIEILPKELGYQEIAWEKGFRFSSFPIESGINVHMKIFCAGQKLQEIDEGPNIENGKWQTFRSCGDRAYAQITSIPQRNNQGEEKLMLRVRLEEKEINSGYPRPEIKFFPTALWHKLNEQNSANIEQ